MKLRRCIGSVRCSKGDRFLPYVSNQLSFQSLILPVDDSGTGIKTMGYQDSRLPCVRWSVVFRHDRHAGAAL